MKFLSWIWLQSSVVFFLQRMVNPWESNCINFTAAGMQHMFMLWAHFWFWIWLCSSTVASRVAGRQGWMSHFSLGTFTSSTLCPHRRDHLCHRRGLGCPGRAGRHRHSPCQGPCLLRGRVWQPLQNRPQGHSEHLHRVQLTTPELSSEQAKHQQKLLSRLLWDDPRHFTGVRHTWDSTGRQGLQTTSCYFSLPGWFFILGVRKMIINL